ncbi:restriction endonuclease subunit S [Lacticaseibacillus paracasei]|uniref:restriction endonuclease subunit S n=1 Tax=Lacticaseibacillus paracasei TaxID=1597 RepID=UPI0021A43A78|nr:restriction endonuclease subunit S [Lacticaseibacillus paracasei]MCT4386209.1 restriction endonuclease subunit S [Lacticaseibacillus paracasei]
MKDNQAKYPQLRFKGFTDPWEERKLSSISERVTRKNKDNESTLPLTISAQDGLVDQNDFFNKQVASRDVTGYFLVKNGEFAYNKSYSNGYPWGAIKRLDKYDMGVLSTLYIVFRPTKINSQFLVSYYDTTRWYREVSKNAAEGARNHGLLNIAPTDFFNTLLVVPKIVDEQQKIGSFFKQLDDTIALHQRKLAKLKELKQGYLQKLFPRNGSKFPQLRFAGFADAWEQRKFKDILKTHSFRSYLAGVSENGEYEVIQQGDKPIVGYSDGEPFTDYKDVTLFGDHTVSLYKPKSPFFVATDGVKILSADNFEGDYLYTTLERYKPEPQGYKRHFTILKNQDVCFTENMEEQQKIGVFFKQLDDTITLHQRKLEKLQELKKGYLQKMFC